MIQPQEREDPFKWDHKFGLMVREALIKQGFGPGSQIFFQDNVIGPHIARFPPGKQEVLYDEMEICKAGGPDYDWERRLRPARCHFARPAPRQPDTADTARDTGQIKSIPAKAKRPSDMKVAFICKP